METSGSRQRCRSPGGSIRPRNFQHAEIRRRRGGEEVQRRDPGRRGDGEGRRSRRAAARRLPGERRHSGGRVRADDAARVREDGRRVRAAARRARRHRGGGDRGEQGGARARHHHLLPHLRRADRRLPARRDRPREGRGGPQPPLPVLAVPQHPDDRQRRGQEVRAAVHAARRDQDHGVPRRVRPHAPRRPPARRQGRRRLQPLGGRRPPARRDARQRRRHRLLDRHQRDARVRRPRAALSHRGGPHSPGEPTAHRRPPHRAPAGTRAARSPARSASPRRRRNGRRCWRAPTSS